MSNGRSRNGVLLVVLAIFSMALLGGCGHADPAALETFAADLFRNAAAALLF